MDCACSPDEHRDPAEREEPEPLPNLPFDPTHVVVPIVRRAQYTFVGRASGSTQVVTIGNGVDATQWQDAQLVVLVHQQNSWMPTAQLTVEVQNVSLTPDAPDVTVTDVESTASSPIIEDATVVPSMFVVALSPPFGPQLMVSLRFAQGAISGTAQTITLSVELVARLC